MAYESLADRYREIEDDISRNGNGGRRRPQQTPPPLDEPPLLIQKPFSAVAQKISDGNPQTTDYSISKEYQTFYDGGTILTGPLATGVHSGTDVYNQEKIKIRKVDVNDLGSAGKLGEEPFTLESLYLKSHANNPNREPIDTGRKDHLGNPIQIPTVRAGMGNLSGLDIKGYSTDEIFYRGTQRGNEPYFVAPIGSEDDFPGNHTSRLVKFYKSPKGQETLLKETFLDFLYSNPPKFNLKKLRLPAIGSAVGSAFSAFAGARFKPGHDNLFYQLVGQSLNLSYKDVQVGDIGGQSITVGQITDIGNVFGSLRQPFAIEYSARTRTGQPFGDLGDRPWNLSFLRNIPVAEQRPEYNTGKFGKLKSFFARQQNKLVKLGLDESDRIANQTTRKVTPFMDLSGGPGDHSDKFSLGPEPIRLHGYDDKIGSTGVEYVKTSEEDASWIYDKEVGEMLPLEDEQNKIEDGDFYVRFKDLRDGGFIYFRGYINGITENLSPSYNSTNYIGRSEPVYSYQRAERDISFNLAVYPQNYKEEVYMYNKIERLTSMAYPEYSSEVGDVRMKKAPFTEMYMAHIGKKDAAGQFGYIKSLSYTVNEAGDWNALSNLPRFFTIAISYQIVSRNQPSLDSKFYGSPMGYK